MNILKSKSIFSVPVLILWFFLLISLVSCNKENPITPPPPPPSGYQFDSARFDWTIDTLFWYGYGFNDNTGFFMLDSVNYYFLTGYLQLVQHDENGIHIYPLNDILPGIIFGKDKNNIFIGGYKIIVRTNNTVLRLIKWNGSSFEDILINDTAYHKVYYIASIYQRNNNELWLGTNLGSLIKYDGTNYYHYFFDSRYHFGEGIGFVEQENQFYAVAAVDDANPTVIDSALIFKYTNDNWENVYKRGYPSPPYFRNNYNVIGGYLYSYEEDGIYKFNGYGFIKILGFTLDMFGLDRFYYHFGGRSVNNILINGPTNTYLKSALYHWNGNKWSKELSKISSSIYYVDFKNNNYYLFGYDYNNAYLFKSKPKNIFKKF